MIVAVVLAAGAATPVRIAEAAPAAAARARARARELGRRHRRRHRRACAGDGRARRPRRQLGAWARRSLRRRARGAAAATRRRPSSSSRTVRSSLRAAIDRVVADLARIGRGRRGRVLRRRPRTPRRARPSGLGRPSPTRAPAPSSRSSSRATTSDLQATSIRPMNGRRTPPSRRNETIRMELATALDRKRSRLAQARLARQLPVREAAAKAGLTEDEIAWLEEGRVYRFRTPDDALLALTLYTTALEIDHWEARQLAGLPVGRAPSARTPANGRGARGRPRRARRTRRRVRAAGPRAGAGPPCAGGAARRGRPPPEALADRRRRAEREREHHLHAPDGVEDRRARLPRSPACGGRTASTIRGRPCTTSRVATTSPTGSRASSASARCRCPAGRIQSGSS